MSMVRLWVSGIWEVVPTHHKELELGVVMKDTELLDSAIQIIREITEISALEIIECEAKLKAQVETERAKNKGKKDSL